MKQNFPSRALICPSFRCCFNYATHFLVTVGRQINRSVFAHMVLVCLPPPPFQFLPCCIISTCGRVDEPHSYRLSFRHSAPRNKLCSTLQTAGPLNYDQLEGRRTQRTCLLCMRVCTRTTDGGDCMEKQLADTIGVYSLLSTCTYLPQLHIKRKHCIHHLPVAIPCIRSLRRIIVMCLAAACMHPEPVRVRAICIYVMNEQP